VERTGRGLFQNYMFREGGQIFTSFKLYSKLFEVESVHVGQNFKQIPAECKSDIVQFISRDWPMLLRLQ
jgi:hypothetical protein